MHKLSTGERLRELMNSRGLKQVDIIRKCEPFFELYKVKIGKSDLSQYLSDSVEPRQNKLFILAKALNVNEAWLMGFDVPMERVTDEERVNKASVTAPGSSEKLIPVTPHEEKVIVSYREQPAMQGAVDKLLGIEDDSDGPVRVMGERDNVTRIAAYGGGTDSDDDTVKHT